jgi:protein phosphatase
MGGHAAGDVASAAVIDAIRPFDVAADGPGQLTAILGRAVADANDRLAAKVLADPALVSMGSTLTAMLWAGSHIAIAHIGDSRAYLLRGGRLRQITEDHVLSRLVANPMPQKTGGFLVRFLDARPGWSADITLRAALPGDRYLLCSDGLSGIVDAGVLRDVLSSASHLDQVVSDLVRLTHEAGAPDNVTVLVADVPDGTWPQQDGDPVTIGAAADLARVS